MPDAPRSPLPLLLAAACYAAAVAILSLGVLWGVEIHLLEPRPAAAGVVVSTVAILLAAALTLAPAGRVAPRLLGSMAIGLVMLLVLAGFLFGPLSLFVVAGVPVAGATTGGRLGMGWGRAVLVVGSLGGLALALGGATGVLPVAPAFVDPSIRASGPIFAMQTTLLLLGVTMVGLLDLGPQREEEPVIDTVVPAPPRRTTRTGSFTLSELALLDGRSEARVGDESLEVQKLESLGVLAGGVAHDFNNLLMSILGNTSVALTDLDPEHPAWEPLREIETASKRARDLVGQLLAYAGKGGVAASPVDLNHLVREMGDLLQTAMKARAPVDYDLCSGTAVVMADPTQLRQVVMNLITNAGDAMKGRRGEVRVSTKLRRVEVEELRQTLLGAECEAGPYVVLSVSDDGCGMDGATLERIFDPFYTTKRTGRGLGLAAVLGIVRRYGGTMEVESVLDQGTTFRLFMPYAASVDDEEDFATENTSTARGWTPDQAGTVLVVDDDPVVRMVTARMLQRLGFEVLEAVEGAEGVAQLEAHPHIRAVVLDMTMPGMSGLETMTALRAIQPTLPIVLVSGYSEDEVPALDSGVFLQKPYTLKQLTRALDEVLDVTITD
ncbi:MAG: response regulator [Alphaproteobacteria bacterium]|nr:response regulator [Alphaproteobacteria bacterium]MCB9692336.1 response regulator [Alphaproteobacteria bacterium]